MKFTGLFDEFFSSEKAGGLILILCSFISLLLTNSFLGEGYLGFWHSEILSKPVNSG